jgi:hypothetical protein
MVMVRRKGGDSRWRWWPGRRGGVSMWTASSQCTDAADSTAAVSQLQANGNGEGEDVVWQGRVTWGV